MPSHTVYVLKKVFLVRLENFNTSQYTFLVVFTYWKIPALFGVHHRTRVKNSNEHAWKPKLSTKQARKIAVSSGFCAIQFEFF